MTKRRKDILLVVSIVLILSLSTLVCILLTPSSSLLNYIPRSVENFLLPEAKQISLIQEVIAKAITGNVSQANDPPTVELGNLTLEGGLQATGKYAGKPNTYNFASDFSFISHLQTSTSPKNLESHNFKSKTDVRGDINLHELELKVDVTAVTHKHNAYFLVKQLPFIAFTEYKDILDTWLQYDTKNLSMEDGESQLTEEQTQALAAMVKSDVMAASLSRKADKWFAGNNNRCYNLSLTKDKLIQLQDIYIQKLGHKPKNKILDFTDYKNANININTTLCLSKTTMLPTRVDVELNLEDTKGLSLNSKFDVELTPEEAQEDIKIPQTYLRLEELQEQTNHKLEFDFLQEVF